VYKEKPILHRRESLHVSGELRTVSIDVTSKCNMACKHCYAEPFLRKKEIDLISLKRTMDELYDMGVFHYVLQGGEPIVDKIRLEKIVEMCRPEESFLTLVTNGWEMSRENILWLQRIGIDKLAFSLDSGIESEHDLNRREGSFKRVLQAIDETVDIGLDVSVSTVVTHQSLYSESFNKVYELLKEKRLRFDVQIAEPVGKWDGRADLLITKEDALYIKRLQKESPKTWNGRDMIKRDIYCGDCDHCPAGKEFMAISADGNLLPCNFLQFTLGRIDKIESIRKARQDLLSSPWFKNIYGECILGENKDFIDEFILSNVEKEKPLCAYKAFNLLK
jgi:MoaA/NifB/PqqE/SkfB family radical SAM enzyme